jgi:hypothetical protein
VANPKDDRLGGTNAVCVMWPHCYS